MPSACKRSRSACRTRPPELRPAIEEGLTASVFARDAASALSFGPRTRLAPGTRRRCRVPALLRQGSPGLLLDPERCRRERRSSRLAIGSRAPPRPRHQGALGGVFSTCQTQVAQDGSKTIRVAIEAYVRGHTQFLACPRLRGGRRAFSGAD